jgi:hypothetical protein
MTPNDLAERMLVKQVRRCIDFEKLAELQERMAIELGRSPDVTDEQMLVESRSMITRALHRIADGSDGEDQDLRVRYWNAICRETERELDRP